MLYLSGASILKIKQQLEEEDIPAPRGGKTWPKKTIESILTNAKYSGSTFVHTHCIAEEDNARGIITTDNKGEKYITYAAFNDHPPIISTDTFDKVQQMRLDRSNVERKPDGTKVRKNTHYSSKAFPVKK